MSNLNQNNHRKLHLETAKLFCQSEHAKDQQLSVYLNELENFFHPLHSFIPADQEAHMQNLIKNSALPLSIQTDFQLAVSRTESQEADFEFDWIFEKIKKEHGKKSPHLKEAKYVADNLLLKEGQASVDPLHLPLDVRSLIAMLLSSSEGHQQTIEDLKSQLDASIRAKKAAKVGKIDRFLIKAKLWRYTEGGEPLTIEKEIEYGDEGFVEEFLKAGENPNKSLDVYGGSLFTKAINTGDLSVVNLLYRYGANIGQRNSMGFTPLMAAARSGYLDIVRFLVEKGAKIDAASNDGLTALDKAKIEDRQDVVEYLEGKLGIRQVVESAPSRASTDLSGEFEIPDRQPGDDINHQQIKEFIEQSQSHLARADYFSALHAIKAALEVDPKSSMANSHLEDFYNELAEMEQGLAICQDIAQRYPEEALVHCVLGDFYRKQGEHELASRRYHRAIELNPNLQARIAVEALQDKLQGKSDEAAASSSVRAEPQAIGRLRKRPDKPAPTPESVEEHWKLGSDLFAQNDHDSAESHFQKVIKLDPDHKGAYDYLKAIYKKRGDLDSAIEFLLVMVNRGLAFSNDYYELGGMYKEKGDIESAVHWLHKAVAIEPDNLNVHQLLDELYRQEGGSDYLSQYFSIRIASDPGDVAAHIILARIFTEEYSEGADSEFDPNDIVGHIETVCEFFTMHGNIELVKRCLGKALELDPENIELAKKYLEKALELDPENEEIRYSLGQKNKEIFLLALAEGDMPDAEHILENSEEDLSDLVRDNKINVNEQDEDGWTYLAKAVHLKCYKLTEFFLENRANPNLPNKHGRTPLFEAAAEGILPLVELLLKPQYGTEIDFCDNDKETALFDAVGYAQEPVVNYLLEKGIDPTHKNEKGKNALDQLHEHWWSKDEDTGTSEINVNKEEMRTRIMAMEKRISQAITQWNQNETMRAEALRSIQSAVSEEDDATVVTTGQSPQLPASPMPGNAFDPGELNLPTTPRPFDPNSEIKKKFQNIYTAIVAGDPDTEEGRQELQQAIEEYKELIDSHSQTRFNHLTIAQLLKELYVSSEDVEYLRAAYIAYNKSSGSLHGHKWVALREYGMALLLEESDINKLKEAKKKFEEALTDLNRKFDPDPPPENEVAQIQHGLTMATKSIERLEELAKNVQEMVADLQPYSPPEDHDAPLDSEVAAEAEQLLESAPLDETLTSLAEPIGSIGTTPFSGEGEERYLDPEDRRHHTPIHVYREDKMKLLEAVEENPDDYDANWELAFTLHELREYELSEQYFLRCKELDSNETGMVDSYIEKCRLKKRLEEICEAVATAEAFSPDLLHIVAEYLELVKKHSFDKTGTSDRIEFSVNLPEKMIEQLNVMKESSGDNKEIKKIKNLIKWLKSLKKS